MDSVPSALEKKIGGAQSMFHEADTYINTDSRHAVIGHIITKICDQIGQWNAVGIRQLLPKA
jgi:hypothetical protein